MLNSSDYAKNYASTIGKSLSPAGEKKNFFSSAFFEGGGGLVLFSEMYQREQGLSRTDLCNVVRALYCFF